MKNLYGKVLALCMLCVLFFLAAAAMAQSCNPAVPATTPTSRFTDNGNGTVTDKLSGLMWKKASELGTFTWQGALKKARDVNASGGFAGYMDWRVPNINELASIVEEQCYDPAINIEVFLDTPSLGFWSSSPGDNSGSYARGVSFGTGDDGWLGKDSYGYVRLVRGGQ